MNSSDFQNDGIPGDDPYKWIRRLIWLYFLLLIYEGALRKWVVPSLANPLLIVRDPVVIAIYALAFMKGIFPFGGFVGWTMILGIVTFLVSLVSGVGNVFVSLYGWRTDFLHLPLIFVMPKVLTARQVRALCIGLLLTAIPMALLVMAQFKAGPTAWVNVGVGGGEGGQLDVGFGKIRPPGTFSFTNGLANYVTLVAAALLFAVLDRKYYPRWLLFTAAPATILMIVISGSRATVSAVVISVAMLALICLRRPSYIGGSVKFVLLALPGLYLIMSLPVFQEGLMVHTARFGESGGGIKQGILIRALGDYLDGFRAVDGTPFLGYGLGVGTNAAAGMMGGERGFLLAEGEWARVVKEGGPIFGFAYLFLRVLIAAYLGWMASFAFERQRNPLPLLLFSACLLLVLSGQFGQPTALGFAVFGAGLCMASMNAGLEVASEAGLTAVAAAPRRRRGRSVFAEELHGGFHR